MKKNITEWVQHMPESFWINFAHGILRKLIFTKHSCIAVQRALVKEFSIPIPHLSSAISQSNQEPHSALITIHIGAFYHCSLVFFHRVWFLSLHPSRQGELSHMKNYHNLSYSSFLMCSYSYKEHFRSRISEELLLYNLHIHTLQKQC